MLSTRPGTTLLVLLLLGGGAFLGLAPTVSAGAPYVPGAPYTPDGVYSHPVGTVVTYCAVTTDPDGNNIQYVFKWGDGTQSVTGYHASGTEGCLSHTWSAQGSYCVTVYAQDVIEPVRGESGCRTETVTAPPCYVAGVEIPGAPACPPSSGTGSAPYTPLPPHTLSGYYGHYQNEPVTYCATTSDPDGDAIVYTFYWGDGTSTIAAGHPAGAPGCAVHAWSSIGWHCVQVSAQDTGNGPRGLSGCRYNYVYPTQDGDWNYPLCWGNTNTAAACLSFDSDTVIVQGYAVSNGAAAVLDASDGPWVDACAGPLPLTCAGVGADASNGGALLQACTGFYQNPVGMQGACQAYGVDPTGQTQQCTGEYPTTFWGENPGWSCSRAVDAGLYYACVAGTCASVTGYGGGDQACVAGSCVSECVGTSGCAYDTYDVCVATGDCGGCTWWSCYSTYESQYCVSLGTCYYGNGACVSLANCRENSYTQHTGDAAACAQSTCHAADADPDTLTACVRGDVAGETCLGEAALTELLFDTDGDGYANAAEAEGNSDPSNPPTTPNTDDDCDGKANAAEADLAAALGIAHPVVSVTGGGVSVDPNTLEAEVDPPTFGVHQEGGSSC